MSNTLSTASSAGITLTASGAYLSPFTITPAGVISTAGSFGIYSAIAAPMLLNNGFIAAAVGGVDFTESGTVVNAGTILATGNGVFSGAGVYLLSGGDIANSGTGAVISGNVGIESETLAATIANSGTITGITGIALASGGVVTNIGKPALISGSGNGAALYGPMATVVNQGTITGNGFYGVQFETSGSAYIDNSGASAMVSGGSDGILFKSAGGATVVNDGTIIGVKYVGVYSNVGGFITNTGTSAAISGASGISLTEATGTVVNSGAITGTGDDGVFLGAGGSVSNDGVAATISGESFGVAIETGAGMVVNGGTITGTSQDAIYLDQGSVTNSGAAALIAGGTESAGVFLSGAGNVENQGTILGGGASAGGGDGVKGFQYVTVNNSGLIIGGSGSLAGAGVYLYAQSTLNNQGTLIGGYGTSYGNGARVKYGDFITNGAATDSSALILGNNGVVIEGNSSLDNYGTIAGRNNGVYILQTISAPAGLVNQASGTIIGLQAGVYLKSSPSVTNTGLILNAGQITASLAGIYEHGVGGTILNTGTITVLGFGTPAFGDGIFITGGAEVVNGSSTGTGAVIGGLGIGFGIDMSSGAFGPTIASVGTVINYGTVHGGSQQGVQLAAGTVVNGTAFDSQALITGIGINGNAVVENFGTLNANGEVAPALQAFGAGIILNGATNDTAALIESTGVSNVSLGRFSTLTNYGTIQGGSIVGIYSQSGVISNAATGVIIGGKFGANVAGYGAQTVINAGVIEGTIALNAVAQYAYNDVFSNAGTIASLLGSSGTAIQFSKGNDLLIDDPAGVFIGTVSGGKGENTIELAAGGAGSIAGLGTQFTQFSTINLDPGAIWQIEGDSAGLASGQTINGFAAGDAIILDGFTETGFSYVSGAGIELTGSNATSATIDIAGSFSTSFNVENVAAGTEITLEVTCFARGTRIMTAAGEVEVEALKIGDLVKTLHAGMQRVKWIGTRSYAAPFANHVKVLPVCIKAGALAENVPARDLLVSPGHAICIDGALIHAGRLVNGVSITQAERVEEITYFHVELERHEVIFAEHCPAESFLGEVFRAQFHNAASYRALYPEGMAPEHACLPRLEAGFALDAIKRRLARRAGIAAAAGLGPMRGYVDQAGPEVCSGWAQDLAAPDRPVCLDIFIRGERVGRVLANLFREDLRAAGIGGGECGFAFQLPAGRRGEVEVRRGMDGAALGWTQCARTMAG